MKIVLIVFAVFLAVMLILPLVPIRLILCYDKDSVKNEVSLTVKYLCFKFKPSKKDKTRTKKQKQPEEKTEPFSYERQKTKLDRYIKLFDMIKEDVVHFLKYASEKAVVFENIEVTIDFGFEDAMQTGIFTGLLNGFVYSVLGIIHHNSKLENMNVNIQPFFDKECFNSHIKCILRLKNVHIIIIAINVLKLIRKIKKTEGSR